MSKHAYSTVQAYTISGNQINSHKRHLRVSESVKRSLLSNVNTAISVTAAKSTRRTDGINWLAKIPGCNIHMVMMNEPRALK